MNENRPNRQLMGVLALLIVVSRAGLSAADSGPEQDRRPPLYEQLPLSSLQAKVDAAFHPLIAKSESKFENEWDSLFDAYQGLSIKSLENLQRLLRDRNTIQNANRS